MFDHPNLKPLDRNLEMDTYVTISENQPWEHQIWEFRKIDQAPVEVCILR